MDAKNNIMGCLSKNQNVVVVSKSLNYEQTMMDMHKAVSKEFKKICMVTLNKPSSALVKKFQEEGIDYSNYCFIDCVPSKEKVGESKQDTYVSSPSSLTELMLTIDKIKKIHQIDLMILDNISSLLIYNKDVIVLKFLHSLMTRIRQTDTKVIYSILQKDMKGPMEDISLFADAVIKA